LAGEKSRPCQQSESGFIGATIELKYDPKHFLKEKDEGPEHFFILLPAKGAVATLHGLATIAATSPVGVGEICRRRVSHGLVSLKSDRILALSCGDLADLSALQLKRLNECNKY
ncbi:MAG TPA: hypothetical protein DHV53_06635, partial [Gammaproteobacteria bacterium]|nr:hypothetical protein [Gammaproteobacteria bacterium]